MIPQRLELADIQQAFRDFETKLGLLLTSDIEMNGRRMVGAGVSIAQFDYVTRFELDKAISGIETSLSSAQAPSALDLGYVRAAAPLTANAIMLGAGLNRATVVGSLGTATTVLHGNAAGAPTFGAVVLTTDVSGVLPRANGGSDFVSLFDHFTDVGNVGTGEDDLYSDTLAAGQFAANGDKVFGHYAGIFVGSATATQTLKLYVGGTLCFDSGALALGAVTDTWTLDLFVIRVSATVLRVSVFCDVTVGALPFYTEVTGLTLTNQQIVKITGEAIGVGAANNQIVAKMSTLAYSKAA